MTKGRAKGELKRAHLKHYLTLTVIILTIVIVALFLYPGYLQRNVAGSVNYHKKAIGDFSLVSTNQSTQNGQIAILFIGAEACPFCTAESWAIVASLQQSGSWENLSQVVSNATDSIPSVPGYSFTNATLSSDNISFREVELTTTSWSHNLQAPNASESTLFHEYDPQGLIPFFLIGGEYLHIGSAISPRLISGMSWNQSLNLSKSHNVFDCQILNEKHNISEVLSYLENTKSTTGSLQLPFHGLMVCTLVLASFNANRRIRLRPT